MKLRRKATVFYAAEVKYGKAEPLPENVILDIKNKLGDDVELRFDPVPFYEMGGDRYDPDFGNDPRVDYSGMGDDRDEESAASALFMEWMVEARQKFQASGWNDEDYFVFVMGDRECFNAAALTFLYFGCQFLMHDTGFEIYRDYVWYENAVYSDDEYYDCSSAVDDLVGDYTGRFPTLYQFVHMLWPHDV